MAYNALGAMPFHILQSRKAALTFSDKPVGFIIFYVAAILIIAGFFHLSKVNFNNKDDKKKNHDDSNG